MNVCWLGRGFKILMFLMFPYNYCHLEEVINSVMLTNIYTENVFRKI